MRLYRSQVEALETLRNRGTRSASERRTAYLFATVYLIAIGAVFLSWLHFTGQWVTSLSGQMAEMILALMYTLNINEYVEKTSTALSCERAVNPIIDMSLIIHVFLVLLHLWQGTYVLVVANVIVLGVAVNRIRRGAVYVDATNLWRDRKLCERNSMILVITEVLAVVTCITCMVFSIIYRYG